MGPSVIKGYEFVSTIQSLNYIANHRCSKIAVNNAANLRPALPS
jgi:hypothetical protein